MKVSAVLIAGPTASGKSALAARLAAETGGVVVNADSMQVYGDLHIITARPYPPDMAGAPHLLYGHVDGAADYSVGRWLTEARAVLDDARRDGRLAVFVGGTGLYFRALTLGLADIPAVPDDVRAAVRGAAERMDDATLHAALAARDEESAARLNPADRQRVLRALEVITATGRPLGEWQAASGPPALDAGSFLPLVLEVDRAELRARIDARFRAMVDAGALDEVARLKARHLPADRTLLKAHGVPALMRHLDGALSLEEAIAEGQGDTRRYAKRQLTFFRNQMADWPRASPQEALDLLRGALAR